MDFSDIFGNNNCQENIDNNDDNINKEIINTDDLFKGETIRIDETPTTTNWKYQPLFLDRFLENDTLVWQIGYEDDKVKIVSIDKIETIDGNIKTIRKLYIQKYKEGYLPIGPELTVIKPMTGKKYCTHQDKLKTNETRITKFPVSVMENIDGCKALAKLQGTKVSIRSKTNNLYPKLDKIKSEIQVFLMYLPVNCELDGEIYNPSLTKSQLSSKLKNLDDTGLEYWIYDVIDSNSMVWEDRYSMMVNALTKYLEDGNSMSKFRILQAYNCNSHDDIEIYHNRFVNGIMIRHYGSINKKQSTYKGGQNNNLVKYK